MKMGKLDPSISTIGRGKINLPHGRKTDELWFVSLSNTIPATAILGIIFDILVGLILGILDSRYARLHRP